LSLPISEIDSCGPRLYRLRKNCNFVIPRAGVARGICFFLGFAKKQIPRCTRDDDKKHFFRTLFAKFRTNIETACRCVFGIRVNPAKISARSVGV
jgi:hypothetical protein